MKFLFHAEFFRSISKTKKFVFKKRIFCFVFLIKNKVTHWDVPTKWVLTKDELAPDERNVAIHHQGDAQE